MQLCFSHGLSVAGSMTFICSFVLLALNVILASVPSAAISKQIVLAAWKDFHFIKHISDFLRAFISNTVLQDCSQ